MIRTLKNRGDTIVEVIIVLAVLSLAISISYTTANRSLLGARQAQENAKATQLLHSQIEELRYLAPAEGTAKNIFQTGPFCIERTDSGDYEVATPAPPDPSPHASCHNVDSLYDISITYENTPPDKPDTFTVIVSWEDVSGEGNNSVQMNYRVHKPTPPPVTDPGPVGLTQCNDGIDNGDGDGLADYPQDPDCSSLSDNTEAPAVPAPCITIAGSGGFPAWHLASTGGVRKTQSFTIKNTACPSPVPMTISNISIAGADAADFGITSNTCGLTLTTGSTCAVVAEFHPATGPSVNRHDNARERKASLEVSSNAINSGSVALAGWTITDRLAPGESIVVSPTIDPGLLAIRGWTSSCYNDALSCQTALIQFRDVLALYPNAASGYASWIRPMSSTDRLSMQADANLVMYNTSGVATWASAWEGGPFTGSSSVGYWLKVYDGGALRIMNPSWNSIPDNGAAWASAGW